MVFDFSGNISRGINSIVNTALDSAVKYVGTLSNFGVSDKIQKGTEKVLNDIGAPPIVQTVIRNINAKAVQSGVNSVTEIMTGVVNGVITSTDLRKYTNMDVVMAAIKAGDLNALNIYNINNLAGIARNITIQPSSETVVDLVSSPYATDIANIFSPKLSFLFVAEFIFNEPFNNYPVFSQNDINVLVYKFDRPKIEIEHEEVNMYNFITQVPKNIKYSPVTFTVYDDVKSNSMSALVQYVRTISPLFNIENSTAFEEIGGLNFQGTTEGNYNASVLGPIQYGAFSETGTPLDNLKTIFKEIRIYHVYNFGEYVDVYKFYNPKIVDITMDDLNMSETRGNSITFEIVYDGFFIDVQKKPTDIPSFEELNFGARFNMVNRDTKEGANIRAEQMKQIDSQYKLHNQTNIIRRGFNQQDFLDNAAFFGNFRSENSINIEQYLRNRELEIGASNINSIPSISTEKIVNSIVNSAKKLF